MDGPPSGWISRRDTFRLGALGLALSSYSGSGGGADNESNASLDPLGFVEIEGTTEVAVDEHRAIAYVAVRDGFATVDVSDPVSPVVLADRRDLLVDREGGPLDQVHDCKVENDRLVVSAPAFSGELTGFLLYDVSDPATPIELAFFETDHPIHNAFISDTIVYLTANDGDRRSMVIVDVRDDDPTIIGEWSLTEYDDRWADVHPDLRFIHDIWVQDDVAFIAHWDAGTWIVDVRDPGDPIVISRFGEHDPADLADLRAFDEVRAEFIALPGNDHYVTVDEEMTLLALGREAWSIDGATDQDPSNAGRSGGPGGIELWDIRDLTSPTKLSAIEPPSTPDPTRDGIWTTAHNCSFADGLLYTSWYEGGVKVHDVLNPSEPVEIASWADRERASFWRAHASVPGEFFVASSHDINDRGFDQGLFTFPDPPRPEDSSTPSSDPAPTDPDQLTGIGFGALGVFWLTMWWVARRKRHGRD